MYKWRIKLELLLNMCDKGFLMKYDNLMILASLEFIIICFLVYIGFKLKEALELRDTVIIELIQTSIKAIESCNNLKCTKQEQGENDGF